MASKPIFDKILVANRGEIACRVIKTCRRLGIKTVAVHSVADEQAKHVRMADEQVCIGPAASKDSYLRVDKIVDACLKTKANAVHPGYGFLSEKSQFSAELKKNGIIFIGPDAHSIESMGDKINSKRLAKEAGVTTIPGFIGEIKDQKHLLEVANAIGYPVMVKASSGGGGKGMRIAYGDKECVEVFELCKEEALSAFGDDTMLVEKFIENPRHIEMQVIADRVGNTLWLPERECSIQRRNQKVLEEAPSTFLTPETRRAMGEEAVAMARKVQYVGAGTVENVVDPRRQFYFLEMNTRLQVEHPITEMITGFDLVEEMIRAAAGLPLSFRQEDVTIKGWATEARVYAEDPTRHYFPSIGRLSQYQEPHGDGIRVDSGILEGSQISVYYDPLIAKLCAWGKDRDESLDRLQTALDEYVIRGLRHNVCLLRDVINEPKYRKGEITTKYLEQHYPEGFQHAVLSPVAMSRLLAVGCVQRYMRQKMLTRVDCNEEFTSGRGLQKTAEFVVGIKGTSGAKVLMQETGDNVFHFACEDTTLTGSLTVNWEPNFPLCKVNFVTGFGVAADGVPLYKVFQFFGTDEVTYQIQADGSVFQVDVLDAKQAALMQFMAPLTAGVLDSHVHAPMPGVIVGLAVQPGDLVSAGSELLTLEAMKMRNKIRAEFDCEVLAVKCKIGDNVEDEAVLIEVAKKKL